MGGNKTVLTMESCPACGSPGGELTRERLGLEIRRQRFIGGKVVGVDEIIRGIMESEGLRQYLGQIF